MAAERRTIELTEYAPQFFAADDIPQELGEALYRNYDPQVAVDFPSPKTDGQWRLTARGWVGYIPLTPELGITLLPKVELGNLFRMLEYAYRLRSFVFVEGLTQCESLNDFYERLANVLAQRVIDRARKGLYRAYVAEDERLPYARGRLDVCKALRTPWQVRLPWHYQEHTTDIEDNQILIWTLLCIARSGLCTERVLPTVRRAYRSLQGLVAVLPQHPSVCFGRVYHRLNEDYQPLHALCRFFLEHTGPRHETGDYTMLPFLLDMERLFELFVAQWLKAHLPEKLTLMAQERVSIGAQHGVHFGIDLVLYDAVTGEPVRVLDTKYKRPSMPETSDIAQVVTYAEIKGCREAVLIYPTAPRHAFDQQVGNIRVRCLTFSLDDDLEQAGSALLDVLTATDCLGSGSAR